MIHGDCFEVLPSIPSESVDLVLTDPPYGNLLTYEWDNINNYLDFSRRWILETKRILKPNGQIYVWCSIGEKSSSLLDIASILREEFIFRDMIVWAKQRGRGNRRGWLFCREEILWATKSKDYTWNKEFQYTEEKYEECWIKRLKREDRPYKRATNVWKDIKEPSLEGKNVANKTQKQSHPCQKPERAIERIILSSTNPDDTVLDMFAGSGIVGKVCAKHNRKSILIEKDEEYVKQYEAN